MTSLLISPESAAKSLLKELKIKFPQDLWDLEILAYYLGVLVRYAPLDGSEARLSVVGAKAVITISDKVTNPHRQRFSIAHELGHLEMHRDSNGIAICTDNDLNMWGQKTHDVEQEANTFAAAFLLPQAFIEPIIDQEEPSLEFISRLARRFQVSLTATALRYTQFCSEPVAIVYSQAGRILWFRSSASFQDLGVYIERNVKLHPLSSASVAAGNQRYQEPNKVPVTAWFAKGNYLNDAQIIEHSWYIARYDAVMTLLWVDDDISNIDDFIWH